DAQADKRFKAKESIIKSNIHSAMCVPLYNNKEIIGIIYADRISLLDQFSDSDLKLLTLLSNLAAVKIENARLVEKAIENERMEKELALAAQIQKDLLPKENPEFEKMDITGSNVPCYQVGGDYFDFIELDSKRLGIVIADVSGKGVGASLLMASLRACLHSEVDSGCSLEKMALRLNDFVHKSSSSNCFITFFYCEYDNKKNELRYINAGHNPPLLIEKKGTVDRFEISGLCLGMFPSSEYEEKKIIMSPGDTLLLYTDGITESRNKKGEEFTEERMINIAKQNIKLPAQDLMKKIFEEVNEFTSGVNQMDDMTMIVLKRTH
ncbi:MAG: SpoIIE family protein phosphatase, partial [Candidatus Aminicenantaceae bacterium]